MKFTYKVSRMSYWKKSSSMRRILLVVLMLVNVMSVSSQPITGSVKGKEAGKLITLPFASVYWSGTNTGVSADSTGLFTIGRVQTSRLLVASHIGFLNDTIEINGNMPVHFILDQEILLDEVIIEGDVKATTISPLKAMKVELLTEKEFKKAACCNLSESFETNPTVEVSYSDAISGIRQIQMLGLSGKYSQILFENIPFSRGLSSTSGLSYVPGPWVEQLHLAKGTGSVAYGYEGITGQINFGLKAPEQGPRLLLNAYGNIFGRAEANFIGRQKISDKWYSSVLLHGNLTRNNSDPDGDGFRNLPGGEQINFMNRWRYEGQRWEGQFGFQVMDDSRTGGQKDYKRGMPRDSMHPYGMQLNTRQYMAWAKTGLAPTTEQPWSLGFIASGIRYEYGLVAGLNNYLGLQSSLYLTAIINRSWNDKHIVTAGASFTGDNYEEDFNRLHFARTELVPGIYGEYTFAPNSRFATVGGFRADHHNLFGLFFTPRIHLRYAVNSKLTVRGSAGRGQRTANVLAENSSVFFSSRKLFLPDTSSGTYGLNPEVAWNYGSNATYDFRLFHREAQISVDYYHVNFVNQAVVDLDRSALEVNIYDLKGVSFSHTFQAQLSFEPLKKLNLRMAYRYFDVRTTYDGILREQSLLSAHRGFINAEYTSKSKWSFDLTAQFAGPKRLPNLSDNPAVSLNAFSPPYTVMHAQISKKWKRWEFYAGGENLLNVIQPSLILDAKSPYGPYFDASVVWGPSMGRMAYTGVRYEVK